MSEGLRVLVTGGAGLIGSHIIDQLVSPDSPIKCREIIAVDNFVRGRRENLSASLPADVVRIVEGDILDRPLLGEVMSNVDLVFHQAAIRITQCAQEPRLALDVLANGTFNVLEAAVEAGVGKIVAASSASVYGMAESFPTSESHHPYNNRTIYGAAKTFNEGLLRGFHDMYGIDYVGLRYFNVYGPRMDVHGKYTEVLIRWMERIENGQAPLIFGDGLQTMDFVFSVDIARANLLAAVQDVTDEVFNVACGEEISLNDLAAELLAVMDSDLEPEYGPERGVNPVPRRLADVEKARRMLGFEAQVPLQEGLRRLVEWWREARRTRRAG